MKNLIILSALVLMSTQANAVVQCRVAHQKPVIVNGDEVYGQIINLPETVHGRQVLFTTDGNEVVAEFTQGKTALYSTNPETAEIFALTVAKSPDYLMLYDSINKQTITCEKKSQIMKLAPRYIRSAAEGGSSEGPKVPDYKGCWIISCAY